MIDKANERNKKQTIAVSFRMNEDLKNKWYEMAGNDRRRPVNWLEVVIEEKWEKIKKESSEI